MFVVIFSGRTWTRMRGWTGNGEMMDGAEGIFQPDDLEPGKSFGFAVEEFSCPRQKNKFIRQNMFIQLYMAKISKSVDHIREKYCSGELLIGIKKIKHCNK